MQYGYPQWGHGGIQNFNAPSYASWPSPQGFGQQVSWDSWPSGNSWPSNVSFQPNRPPSIFQGPSNPVMSGINGQNHFVGISQNSGPYYQITSSAAVTVRQPSYSTTQNSGPINQAAPSNPRSGPAASQAAPRRESGPSAGGGSRTSQNQQSNLQISAAGHGPSDSSKAAPRAAHVAVAAPEADNYNTGIKLQEVRIGSDKALKVMKITPGSSAELCGVINVGDRLVKIGDTDVYNSYDTARVRDLLSGARGSRIWMAFENALRAEFEVELVRNVRSIKRPSEAAQNAPGPSAPAITPGNKPSSAAQPQGVMRKPDVQETKPSSAPASTNRLAQAHTNSQNRSPSQGQKGVSGHSQQMGNAQIRADASQTKQATTTSRPSQGQSSTPNGSSRPNQVQPVSTQSQAAQGVSSNPVPQQSTQSSSQIVYGHRPVTGPFGQYNSMQYTIIGGSLAGSVVGGSHAGSVVGDSLTPSLVIGDWFGGDYV